MSPSASQRPSLLFAEDFDLPPHADDAVPEPEIIAPTFAAEDIDAVRQEAWKAGYEAGITSAESTSIALARAAMPDVAAALALVADEAGRLAEEAAEAMAQMLVDGLATLFPAMAAAHGASETRSVVRAILPALQQEPRATVRVAPDLADALAGEITMLDPDLADRVAVVADPTMAPGDVRASWATGTATRDTLAAWHEVAAVLSQAGWCPATQPGRILANVE